MRIRSARLAAVFAALALLTSLGAPALAGDVQPVRVLSQDAIEQLGFAGVDLEQVEQQAPIPQLRGLGMTDVESQLVRSQFMPATGNNYGFADDIDGVPALDVPAARPFGYTNLQLDIDPADLPEQSNTDTGLFATTPDLPGGTYTVLVAQMEGNYDGGNGLAVNEGLAVNTPSGTDWVGNLNGDFWNRRDRFPTLRRTETDISQQTFVFAPPSDFPVDPAIPSFTFRQDDILVVGAHTDALLGGDPLGETTLTLVIHHSPMFFTPGSVYQGMDEALTPNDPFAPGTFCCFIDPTPDPQPEPEVDPDAAVSENPVTPEELDDDPRDVPTDNPAVVSDEAPDGSNTSDGSFRTWVSIAVIVVGGTTFAIGYWKYYRTRTRDEDEDDDGPLIPGPPGVVDEGDGDDPRDTPVVPEEHTECDWELHYWDGVEWVVLRAAPWNRHKCCIYKVKVGTKITRHEQAASFRQDVNPERLYMPDFAFGWTGLNYAAHASTRSGPEGIAGWMHGLGDALDQSHDAPDSPYWQMAQGEERPEVAVHVDHEEKTRVRVNLESGCTDPHNEYDGESHATITHNGTLECTNDDPAICPIELNAFGRLYVHTSGDLNYMVGHSDLTDFDELERLTGDSSGPEDDDDERVDEPSILPPPPGAWDSHDHEQRDRVAFSGDDHDHDFAKSNEKWWATYLKSGSQLHAAQLVPEHVWGTTERVSTYLDHDIDTNLRLDAKMTKGDCAATGCCTGNPGHVCHCDPQFKLVLNDTQTAIIVDGKTFAIDRPSRGGREFPPEIPNPNRYQAWPLV